MTKMLDDVAEDANAPEFGGRIHPLQLAMDGNKQWVMKIGS